MQDFLIYSGVVGVTAVIWLFIRQRNNRLHMPRSQASKERGWRYQKLGNNPRFRLSGITDGIHWQLLPEARRSSRYLWATQTPLSSNIAITIRPKGMPEGTSFRMGFATHSMQSILKRVQTFQQDGESLVQTMVAAGSEQFQRCFYVWGSEETAVYHYLDHNIQQKLLAWTEKQAKQTWPEINIAPYGMYIIVTTQLTAGQMVEIVELGEMLIGHYKTRLHRIIRETY